MLSNLVSNVIACGRAMSFKRMSSVNLQTSRGVTSQCDYIQSVGSLLTRLHMRAFHGRSCTGKVSYATQGGLIKLNSADGLFEPPLSARER